MANTNEKAQATQAQAETKNNGGMKMKFEEFKAKKMAERNANKTKGGVNMKEVLNKAGKVIIENTPVTNKKMDAKLDPIREELKHNEVDSVTNSLMIQMLAKEMGVELPSEDEVREFAREMVKPVKEEAPAPATEEKEEAPKKMSFMEKMKAKAEQAKADFKAGYEEERYKGMSDRETREAKKKAFINQMYGDAPAEETPVEETVESAPSEEVPNHKVVADYTQETQTEEVDPLAFGKPLA